MESFAVCFPRGFCACGSHVFQMLLINLTDRNVILKTNLKGGHSIHFTVKSHNLSLQPSSKIEMLSKVSLRADILACDILVTLAVPWTAGRKRKGLSYLLTECNAMSFDMFKHTHIHISILSTCASHIWAFSPSKKFLLVMLPSGLNPKCFLLITAWEHWSEGNISSQSLYQKPSGEVIRQLGP